MAPGVFMFQKLSGNVENEPAMRLLPFSKGGRARHPHP